MFKTQAKIPFLLQENGSQFIWAYIKMEIEFKKEKGIFLTMS